LLRRNFAPARHRSKKEASQLSGITPTKSPDTTGLK
jgi:hypothetical protein